MGVVMMNSEVEGKIKGTALLFSIAWKRSQLGEVRVIVARCAQGARPLPAHRC
jgi:hypothetical protein